MNKFKFLLLAIGVAPLSLLAQESSGPIQQIGATVATQIEGYVTDMTTFFTTNAGTIFSILGVAAAIMVVWAIWKFFQKGARKVG